MRCDLPLRISVLHVRPDNVGRVLRRPHDRARRWPIDEELDARDLPYLLALAWGVLLDELVAAKVDLPARAFPHGNTSTCGDELAVLGLRPHD